MGEIEFKTYIGEDVEVVVFFEIQPEEKQTRYYPGCPEEIVFNDIALIDGKSISGLLKKEVFDTLEIQCKEHANELAAAALYGDY